MSASQAWHWLVPASLGVCLILSGCDRMPSPSRARNGSQGPESSSDPRYHQTERLHPDLLGEARPAAVYSSDPGDRWNRIFYLLFARRSEWKVPELTVEPAEPALHNELSRLERIQALMEYYTQRFLSGSTPTERLDGGDLPDFFFFGEIDYVMEDPRYARLITVLSYELENPTAAARTVLARVLFQQDLWNRFDALYEFMEKTQNEAVRRRSRRLLDLLGRLIARVACPYEELRDIPPNFEAIAGSFRQVEPNLFSADSAWGELVPILNDQPFMNHAATAGYRRVFRSFLRVPGESGNPACIATNLNRGRPRAAPARPPNGCEMWDHGLPDGSRAVLMETLVALADNGELFRLPLVVNLESREIRPLGPGEDGRYGLEDLPFDVLHGSRRALLEPQRRHGGLEPLAADEPVPPSLSAFTRVHRGGMLVPARLTCRVCHGFEGRHLMTGNLHGIVEIQVLHPANTLQEENVIRRKRESPQYRALRRYFALPR